MTDHRHITHDNYESWFLLYIDNELSEEQQQQVKQFVTNNPNLALDLEALRAVINHPDEKISFQNKGSLYKKADDELTDEELILFLDGEADNTFSERIAKSNSRQLQQRLSLLRNTYSIADASISYSKKDILYRRGKAIAMRTWLFRVAAAMIVATACIWLYSNTSLTPKDQGDQLAAQNASMPDTQTAPPVAHVNSEQKDTVFIEEQLMITNANTFGTMPKVRNIAANHTSQQAMITEEKKPFATVTPEPEPEQFSSAVIRSTIEPDIDVSAAIAFEEPMPAATIAAATIPEPQKKRNRFFKNVSEKIKETAIDVLSDDNENIIVAGLAINVRK